MTGPACDPILLARIYLAQTLRAEGDSLVLEGLTRTEVLETLSAKSRAEPGPGRTGRVVVGTDPNGAAQSPTPGLDVTDKQISEAPSLQALGKLVLGCARCELHRSRKQAVFGEGAEDARVVCVGEAPGAREDQTGRPFVGRAGQLLDRLLLTIGLPRESVYICNVLKSRPPRNRDPLPSEVSACAPYLLKQLALIRPEVIIAFGAFAARTLLDSTAPLGRLRGEVHEYAGYPVVVTYHPAALLRNPGWTRPSWQDLQIVRRLLDEQDSGV